MNVLIMNLAHDGGGAEAVARQTFDISKYYSDVNTYFLAGRGRFFQGYDVIYPRRTPQKYLNLLMCYLAHNQRFHDGYAVRKIKRLIKKYHIDILHIHNLHGGYIGIDDVKELSKYVKIVWTLHDMWAFTGHCAHSSDAVVECTKYKVDGCSTCTRLNSYAPIARDISNICLIHKQSFFLNCGIHFVSPSKWLKGKAYESILVNEKITVIENGVDTKVYKPFESEIKRLEFLKEKEINSERIILFFVAHEISSPYKGSDLLIEALSQVEHKNNYVLVIAGKGERISVDKDYQVYYTGYISSQEEMRKYYACADAFVIPSRAENYPCTVIEALACGTPVIGSTAGGIPEQIKTDEGVRTGYLFENGDSKALTEVLDNLDKSELNSMRDRCRNSAMNEMSQKLMMDRYYSLYKKVLENA